MVSLTGLRILLLLVGFVWWSIAFVTLYSVQSVGCGWQLHLQEGFAGFSFLRVLLVGLFVFFCLVGGLICLAFFRMVRRREARAVGAPSRFLETSGAFAAYAAAVSILLGLAPVLYASPCT